MPKTNRQSASSRSAKSDRALADGARLDGAHTLGDQPADSSAARADADLVSSPGEPGSRSAEHDADGGERLRLQSEQLAVHLRRRQEDLDRREAELHSGMAELDAQTRAARLWLGERHYELEERAKQLAARERVVEDRLSQLSAAERYQASHQADTQRQIAEDEGELLQREAAVEAREVELVQRERALESALADMERRRQELADEQQRVIQQLETRRTASLQMTRLALDGVERRRAAIENQAMQCEVGAENPDMSASDEESDASQMTVMLARREQLLAEAETQLEADRRVLDEERQRCQRRVDELLRREQRAAEELAESRRRADQEIERQTKKLRAKANELDARQQALDQTREQLERTHREALELRLATDELWSRLVRRIPGEKLIAALADVRRRLDDHYRLAREELLEERERLEACRGELTEQHARLRDERSRVQTWVAKRRDELEELARQVTLRRDEVDREADAQQANEDAWREERLALRDQARRLQSALRQQTAVSRAAV